MGDTRRKGPAYTRRRKKARKPPVPRTKSGTAHPRQRASTRRVGGGPPPVPLPVVETVRAREPGRSRTLGGFVVGILAGMAVLGLVWGIVTSRTGGADATARDTGAKVGAGVPGVSAPTTASRDEGTGTPRGLQSCQRADEYVRAALHAVVPALSQWQVHVGTMNNLVAGAISLQQANAYWKQTDSDASRHLTTFWVASRHAARHQAACHGGAMSGMEQSPAVRSCTRRLSADRHALLAAETAMRTWGHHVMAMNMLRMGRLSGTKAQQMWLASWKEGVRQIGAYHQAAQEARGAGVC